MNSTLPSRSENAPKSSQQKNTLIHAYNQIRVQESSNFLFCSIHMRSDATLRCDAEFGVSWKHAELPRMGRCIKEFVACSHSGQDIKFLDTGFVVWRLDQTDRLAVPSEHLYSCDML